MIGLASLPIASEIYFFRERQDIVPILTPPTPDAASRHIEREIDCDRSMLSRASPPNLLR